MRRSLIVLAVLGVTSGCIERRASSDEPEAADRGIDAAPLADIGPLDAVPPDAFQPMDANPPVDASPPADLGVVELPPLGRMLSCGLTREDALKAIVRRVACGTAVDRLSTVPGLLEAFEAGLFAGVGENARTTSPVDFELGCNVWRCLAAAPSCNGPDGHGACLTLDPESDSLDDPPGPEQECAFGRERCDSRNLDRVVRCARGGELVAMDCAAVGLTCEPDPERDGRVRCVSDTCNVRSTLNNRTCDDNTLTLCEGIRMDCDAWRPGSVCQSFAIGGEIPIFACMPPDFGGAGAYAFPVDCRDDGAIAFTVLQTDAYVFDCRANGYSGCDERGCVE